MIAGQLPSTMEANMLIPILIAAAALAAPQAKPAHPDPATIFANMDTNKDGKVSRAEYVAARQSRFTTLDHNKDGAISNADFPRAAANPTAATRIAAMIDEADANKDGKVTKEELAKAPTPGFDRVDTNHDGVVTQAELTAARAAATKARAAG
jgi:Ca2+-binding EF-hand superfamily protein